jgi:hypothetical protein
MVRPDPAAARGGGKVKEPRYEYCFLCGEPTGRAGKGDDSIYCVRGDGPFCEECWHQHCEMCDAGDEE